MPLQALELCRLYRQIADQLSVLIGDGEYSPGEYPKITTETIREHQAIVSAIVRRDPRAARSAMRRHMDQTHKRYIKDWTTGK